jgi:hypothetical protein
MEYNCQNCEKSFSSQEALNSHKGHMHSNEVWEKCECQYCGEGFEETKYRVEQGKGKYCSITCMNQALSNKFSGEGNPMYGKSNSWGRHTEEAKQLISSADRPTGKNHGNYKEKKNYVSVICEICGEECWVFPSESKSWAYCSRECKHKGHSGENHPSWVGGTKHYRGPNWQEQREKAIKRDNEECQKCGISREQHKEKFDKDLEADHIKPFRLFDDYKEANKLSNLTTYCCVCHGSVENAKTV